HQHTADVREHYGAEDAPQPVRDRERPGRERARPPEERDGRPDDAGDVRWAPYIHIASKRAMPQLVERAREDHRERAEPDQREAKLRSERSDAHLASAHRTAGHRCARPDEGGDAPPDHAPTQEPAR